MGGTPFITRLSLEQRIARAVGFTITVRRCSDVSGRNVGAVVYRKTAATLGTARVVAARMNVVSTPSEPPATIAAITPEGSRCKVPASMLACEPDGFPYPSAMQ